MLFFPGQNLTPPQHRDFASQWGEMEIHPYLRKVEGFPVLTSNGVVVQHPECGKACSPGTFLTCRTFEACAYTPLSDAQKAAIHKTVADFNATVAAAAGLLEVEVEGGRRREGLAHFLLADALQDLAREGVALVETHASRSNLPALMLFSKLGFEAVEHGTLFRRPD